MMSWAIATVEQCTNLRKGLQELVVRLSSGETALAYHYTDVSPAVHPRDQVLLNTTAVNLNLGTGGHHFVHSILSLQAVPPEQQPFESKGHLMKLRYTSLQRKVLSAEEECSPYHAVFQSNRTLAGMPVLIGELHSMLPVVMCWLHYRSQSRQDNDESPPTIVYIMSDGGALPLLYSHHVHQLLELCWLSGTITYGHAYGGQIETLNKFTALIAAKVIYEADIAVVMMGPGIAGTGTMLGHTGVEVGELVNAAAALEGEPIVIPRISFAEQRERHVGLSHHTLSSLSTIALKPARLPLPSQVSEGERQRLLAQIEASGIDQLHHIDWVSTMEKDEVRKSLLAYSSEITSMGRTFDDDPVFFLGISAAAEMAWQQYGMVKK